VSSIPSLARKGVHDHLTKDSTTMNIKLNYHDNDFQLVSNNLRLNLGPTS
jgi:hypothetical protein